MHDRICQVTCPLPEYSSELYSELPGAISGLAERGVSPDTFHREDRDYFATLSACSTTQISLFRNLQTDLSRQIGLMSTQEIADNLRRLYDRAYRYNPVSRTVDVANPGTKRNLDLWIAVIDHRAFQKEAFLNRILERPTEPNACLAGESPEGERGQASREIEMMMALNSPNLSPHDRVIFHRLKHGLMTWEEAARERDDLKERWLLSHDGRTTPSESPFTKSSTEFRNAAIAWVGREAVRQIFRETTSWSRLRRMAGRLGLAREFTRFIAMSDEALMGRIQGLTDLAEGPLPPHRTQRVTREAAIIGAVLTGRGIGYDSARFRESLIRNWMKEGYTREESELWVGLADPSTTASRLDDYQKRNELLTKFRDSYREFLRTPLAERFTPERSDLYNGWTWILTRARMEGIPVTIEEIEKVRREVQREMGVQTSGPMTWRQFVKRDESLPLFVRPDELGGMSLVSGSCAEPFAVSSRMIVNGRLLSDLLRENVDYIAILPEAPLGVVGAYLLFGVVVLDGKNWSATGGNRPSPGYFLEILAHEVVGHQFFGRSCFNEHPTLNFRTAHHELYSYNVTQLTQVAYRDTGCALPSEQRFLRRSAAHIDHLIHATNHRLGLGPEERGLRLTDPRWEGRPIEFFDFQPHDEVVGGRSKGSATGD